GTMNGVALLAGEFDLGTGFERDIGALALEGDDVAFFFLRLPTERVGEAVEEAFNPAFAEVAGCPTAAARDADHFILGADPPSLAWLASLVEIVDELGSVLDDLSRFRPFDVLRHTDPPVGCSPLAASRP